MKHARIRDMKIGKKLMISYLFACLIPLLTACFTIWQVSVRSLEEASLEFASLFSFQIIAGLDNFIEEYDRLTRSVLVDSEVIYGWEAEDGGSVLEQVNRQLDMRKIMMRLMTLQSDINSVIILTDTEELYQFSNDGGNVLPEALQEQEWLQRFLDSGETLTVTAVHDRSYYDRDQDGIVLTVGRSIYDYGGVCRGVLLLDLDPSCLVELSEGFLLVRNNYNIRITITDEAGGTLYDSDVAGGRITWQQLEEMENPLFYGEQMDDYLILTSETRRAGLKVNVVIPRKDLLTNVNEIGHVTGIAVAGCMLAVTLISLLFSRTITTPILRLQKRMKQAEAGQYEPLQTNGREDELGSLIVSYNHMILKIRSLIQNVYLSQIQEKNAKFLALRTQINPHMLYNILESIRMKALVNGEDEIADMIKILARMFRIALENKTKTHSIQDEIDYAENYLKLQNIRFQGIFSMEVNMDSRVRSAEVISLIFQPIIENSIEHGMKGGGIGLHILLAGTLETNGDIIITVQDNGIGMPEERIREINDHILQARKGNNDVDIGDEGKTSIGLRNIAERIWLQYGENYYLKVAQSSANGTIIEMRIPGKWGSVQKEGKEECDGL